MPYAILYRSFATHPMGELSLRALTVRSAQRNAKRQITGLLLHGVPQHVSELAGGFMQWIEGPEGEVRALFGSVRRDLRHDSIEVIAEGPLADVMGASDRPFPEWGMNVETLSDLPATLSGFLAYVQRQRRDGVWARAA